jgi:hypothetical protein
MFMVDGDPQRFLLGEGAARIGDACMVSRGGKRTMVHRYLQGWPAGGAGRS